MALVAVLAMVGPARADEPGPGSSTAAPRHKKSKGKHARGAVFSGRLASTEELRDQPLDRPSGHIELYAVNFHEALEVDLYREDGSFDPDALDKLNHFFRCKRTGTEKSI